MYLSLCVLDMWTVTIGLLLIDFNLFFLSAAIDCIVRLFQNVFAIYLYLKERNISSKRIDTVKSSRKNMSESSVILFSVTRGCVQESNPNPEKGLR